MTTTRILMTTSTTKAAELRQVIEAARTIDKNLAQQKAIMDQSAFGGDWVSLAQEYGFSIDVDNSDPNNPVYSSQDANDAYNLIGSWLVEFNNSPFVRQIIDRMG